MTLWLLLTLTQIELAEKMTAPRWSHVQAAGFLLLGVALAVALGWML